MKTPNLIVRIPEPCHEEWNSMQPDVKGKFCNSCSKAVFDFSTKTDLEIKQILIEYKDQKVCGHFKKSQIDRPLKLKVNLNELPKNISFSKAFTIAVFLVFGSFLFSCTDHKGGKLETVEIVDFNKESSIDGLILVDMQSSPVDSINAVVEALSASALVHELEQQEILGTMVVPEFYSEEILTGDIEYVEEYNGSNNDECVEKNSEAVVMDTINLAEVTIIDYLEPLIDGDMISGKVSSTLYVTGFYNYDRVYSLITDSIEDKIQEMVIMKNNDLKIFPNPSNGEFNINYTVQKISNVNLTIYNINGVLMSTVVDIANQYEGKYQIPVNLNELSNGIYLVTLIVNDKKSVERLVIER